MSKLPRMLRLPAVIELTGLGRDTIYSLSRRGLFPKPRKITERASAWREDEVSEWIESRPVAQLGTLDESDAERVAIESTQHLPHSHAVRSAVRTRRSPRSV